MDLDELRASRAAVVTVTQAAALLGIDVRTVSRAIHNGELPALRIGRRLLIPRLQLLAQLGASDALAPDDSPAPGDSRFGQPTESADRTSSRFRDTDLDTADRVSRGI